MKGIVFLFLSIVWMCFGTPDAAAQAAQEVFDADLELLKTDLQEAKKEETKPASSGKLSSGQEVFFRCEKVEEAIGKASEIMKNKVALRADNKQKLGEVLKLMREKETVPCRGGDPECCKRAVKTFEEFCRLNGLLR